MPRANLPQSKAVFHCRHVRRQAHHAPHRVWTLEIYLDVEIRSNVLDVTTTLDIWLDVIWGIPLNISLSVELVKGRPYGRYAPTPFGVLFKS